MCTSAPSLPSCSKHFIHLAVKTHSGLNNGVEQSHSSGVELISTIISTNLISKS